MAIRTVHFLFAAALLFLAGCAKEPAPGKQDIQNALGDKLPAYAQIADLELEAEQNLGTKVDPDWQARFNAGIRFPADTFLADGGDDGATFVRPAHRAGEVLRVFGKSVSHLFAGKWKSELRFDGDPLAGLGLPLSAFAGRKVVVRGSKEEADYRAEAAERARQDTVEQQRTADEQHRLARQAEQQKLDEQRAAEEQRRRDDEAKQQRLQEEFAADRKTGASPAAAAMPAVLRVPSDFVQPNAVWVDQGGGSLTILERKGDWFHGRYQRDAGRGTMQDVNGTVKDDQIFWTASSVYTYYGEHGGDCYGTFDGDKIYFNAYNEDATYHVVFNRVRANKAPVANAPAAPAPAPAPPVPAAPPAPPAPPFPSARLRDFVNAHVDRVLAPLDGSGGEQPNALTDFRDSLADEAAKAPAVRRPAYEASILVCNSLVNALAQRQQALADLQGVDASKNSGSLGVVSAVGHLSYRQLHSEHRARNEVARGDESFRNSQRNSWLQHAAGLREGIQKLLAHERDTERQVAADEQAKLVEASRVEAVRRYPDLAVKDSKLNRAFVARYSAYQQEQPAYFQDVNWPVRLVEEISQDPAVR